MREHFPALPIFARAIDRIHYYQLKKLGVQVARRELFGSSVDLATEALRALGMRAHTAHRMARRWRVHEEQALEDMAAMWARDEARTSMLARLRQALEEAERIMRDEDPRVAGGHPQGWDNEALRAGGRPDDVSGEQPPTPPR